MSIKVMSLVWDCALPRDEKYVLLCLAYHAQDDGTSVFPAVARVVWKTGYSKKSVQRAIRSLESKEVLIDDGTGPGGVNRWRIDLDALPERPPYQPGRPGRPRKRGVSLTGGNENVASSCPKPPVNLSETPRQGDAQSVINHQETTTPGVLPPAGDDPEGQDALDAAGFERGAWRSELLTAGGHIPVRGSHMEWGKAGNAANLYNRAEPPPHVVLYLCQMLDVEYGMKPRPWTDKRAVKGWLAAAAHLWEVAGGRQDIIREAAQYIRTEGVGSLAGPRSLEWKVRDLLARLEGPQVDEEGDRAAPTVYVSELEDAQV